MSVLLIAIRYVETVRSQIFDQARSGSNQYREETVTDRIIVANKSTRIIEQVLETPGCTKVANNINDNHADIPSSVERRTHFADEEGIVFADEALHSPLPLPPLPLPPLPLLPSPLLCPRRTFLASLILATKFIHDKSYSNRAWSTVCKLPSREVSRCERALGNALQWRLVRTVDDLRKLPIRVLQAA
ncbi:hypothetical protein HHX47_DHR6000453 [Lentinula edodes]|nr:hypothetical protein HHX47_DHR6000453 [Lentinula edodes]